MASDKKSFIRLEGVHKSFDSNDIICGVDLEINSGETLVIIGGSGTGKSVTLKLIIGLYHPEQGNVFFDNMNWRDMSSKEADQARQRFGYVFQGGALFDSLNIKENVAFPIREHTKKTEGEISQIVDGCLHAVGLEGIESKFPSEISGGMQKRVSLARALSMNPEVLLYDEPTTGLDPINSQKINELIVKTKNSHAVTSIVVTHDMQSALFVADKIVMLFKGHLIFQGTPTELLQSNEPQVKRFIAPATQNVSCK
ncbi:MAG: ABC transporter ATP-binding protein [Planctomycetes bacterium]|nr:ABC transporter ATP-binding protein [Planctomycetota bacterium]